MMRWRKYLAWEMALLGAANALRGHLAWQVAPVLAGQVSVSLPLIGFYYVMWGLIWAGLGLAVVRARALQLVLPLALGYQLMGWGIRWLYDRSDYAHALWGRDAVLSLLFLALTAWFVHAARTHPGDNDNLSAPAHSER